MSWLDWLVIAVFLWALWSTRSETREQRFYRLTGVSLPTLGALLILHEAYSGLTPWAHYRYIQKRSRCVLGLYTRLALKNLTYRGWAVADGPMYRLTDEGLARVLELSQIWRAIPARGQR